MISKKMFVAIVAILIVLLIILFLNREGHISNNINQNSTVNSQVNTENEEWNTYLKEKGFALILAKIDNHNSEITPKEKAEFACFWAQSYDKENYNNNSITEKDDLEFTFVKKEYLQNIINNNFVSTLSTKDYKDIFNSEYYVHQQNLNLVYYFTPSVNDVKYNNIEDTYTINFVTHKANNGDKNLQNTISYDDYENENEYNLVVKKDGNYIKIISIEEM